MAALMTAVFEGDVKSTEQLLHAEAHVNVAMRTKGGKRRPIYYAIRGGHDEIVRLLLQQPDIDIKSSFRTKPGTWT